MSEDLSVQTLMRRAQSGNADAQAELFQRYVNRLVALARSHLSARIQQKIDPEDVVQSVFRSFFRRHVQGQIVAGDEQGLWGLLAHITLCKCRNSVAYFQAACRDVRREGASGATEDNPSRDFVISDNDPSPSEVAALRETLEQLISRFSQTRHREIIVLSLQGYGRREISSRVGLAERTVRLVQDRFRKETEDMLLGARESDQRARRL